MVKTAPQMNNVCFCRKWYLFQEWRATASLTNLLEYQYFEGEEFQQSPNEENLQVKRIHVHVNIQKIALKWVNDEPSDDLEHLEGKWRDKFHILESWQSRESGL